MAELLIASAIMIVTVTGILISYLRALELNEVSHNSSLAVQGARSRMEQIRSTAFPNIMANYNNVAFDIAGLQGKGVSYVTLTSADMVHVVVSVSWQQKSGRVYGEDANINGQVNAGEDTNGNGILDSPVMLESNIFAR